jgi:CSLREA domain-containing protein
VFTRSFRRSHARRVARERKRAAQARQRALLAGATLGATAVLAANAEAATYIVNSTADGAPGTCSPSPTPGVCTLRDAVTEANGTGEADTVDLSGVSGAITLDPAIGVIDITDPGGLNINGPGPGTLTVSGGNATEIFQINPGAGDVSISGLTLTAGSSTTDGGAIRNTGAPLTLTNVTISGNTAAEDGGGVYSESPLTVSGSTITGNTAGRGGGIAQLGKYATVAIENSTISGNTAATGGGIFSNFAEVSISGSHVQNNQATGEGGGGIAAFAGSLSLTGSTISGNTSAQGGGGIFSLTKYGTTIDSSTISNNTATDGGGLDILGLFGSGQNPVLVQGSTISGNRAPNGAGIEIGYAEGSTPVTVMASTISGNLGGPDSFGGGVLIAGGLNSPFELVNSTISGNSATDGGGVSLGYGGGPPLLGPGGSIGFDNSTIAQNTAENSGGGIYLGQYDLGLGYESGTAAINSTIVADNTAGGAPNDLFRPPSSTSGGFNDTFSLIENPGNAPLLSSQALITGVDPQLGTLANNGGPTQTMLPSNTSPVIDQGIAQAGLTADQRGEPRTVNNGKAQPPGGDGTDIGAVELPLIPPGPTPPGPTPPGPTPPGPTAPASLGIAATIGPATGITTTKAVLHGTITTNGQAVNWHFEYGRDTNSARLAQNGRPRYGRNTPSAAIGSGQGDVPVSFEINRLKPGTLYHYRLVAVSSSGQRVSSRDATFKTPRAATRVRIGARRASALSPGCVVGAGGGEREVPALAAEATRRRMRLTLRGTIRTRGTLARSAGGTVRVSFTVNLPDGRARRTARSRVRRGRWKISLVAPGVNLDPLPPRYLITVRYSGDRSLQPARTSRRVRLGIECARRIPAPPVTG